MADFCDDSQAASEVFLREALAASRRGTEGPGPDWIGTVPHCRECGDPIPLKRMAAIPGVGLCVECAE